jgi:hypothetical protein
MFANKLQRNPDNAGEFQKLRQNIISQCSVDDFEKGLPFLNPTPAQVFQVLEITLLSESSREIKNVFMQKIGEHVASALRDIPLNSGPNSRDQFETQMMIEAYRDAVKMVAFCQDELAPILLNTKSVNDLPAEEINSYLFAKLQDRLRFMLRAKGLPAEDRSTYADPAPKGLERSKEDFLAGRGAFDPAEVGI